MRRQVRAKPRCGDDARKSYEVQAKIGAKSIEQSTKSDEKSTKIRSWAVLGVQSRFRYAPGRARDGFGTAKSRSWTDPGPPGTRPERPETVQKRSRASPEPPPDRPEATSERDRSIERCRTRLRSDFSTFLFGRATVPMCKKCHSHQFRFRFDSVASLNH